MVTTATDSSVRCSGGECVFYVVGDDDNSIYRVIEWALQNVLIDGRKCSSTVPCPGKLDACVYEDMWSGFCETVKTPVSESWCVSIFNASCDNIWQTAASSVGSFLVVYGMLYFLH